MKRVIGFLAILVAMSAAFAVQAQTTCVSIGALAVLDQDQLALYTLEDQGEILVTGLRIFDLRSNESRLLTRPGVEYPLQIKISPDKRKLVFFPQDQENDLLVARVIELEGGSIDLEGELFVGRELVDYQWLPDSSGLLMLVREAGGESTGLYRYQIGGTLTRVAHFEAKNVTLGGFSPDGSKVLLGISVRHVMRVVTLSWPEYMIEPVVETAGVYIYGLSWNADGSMFLARGYASGTFGVQWIYEFATNQLRQIDRHEERELFDIWSPYDPEILVGFMPDEAGEGSGQLRVRNFAIGEQRTLLASQFAAWTWFDQHTVLIARGTMIVALDIYTLEERILTQNACE